METVQILINPPAGASAIALEDSPPAGWVVGQISDGGSYDATNHKVKWGPFFEPFPPGVRYEVTPPAGDDGLRCFRGTLSVDGLNEAICGDACVERSCCPFLEADRSQPACPACRVGDCNRGRFSWPHARGFPSFRWGSGLATPGVRAVGLGSPCRYMAT
jgi:hypothetical protein